MNKYTYISINDLDHKVYKCCGVVNGMEHLGSDGSQVITTVGFKGERIFADQSIYIDPNTTNVLPVLQGEHAGKSIVVMDETPTHFWGIEFLNYHFGMDETLGISKECFQE